MSLDIHFFQHVSTSRASSENLHPASVVRPSSLQTGKDGQNRGPTSPAATILGLSARRRKVGAGVIVQGEPAWATTDLGAVSAADHGAIARRSRSAAVSKGGATIFEM